ncbi:zinc finger CCCH domain-containing protein 1-like [Brachypodium distachyon]|uniref:C3H1-type domain-containing protein n=1 Tax=Brachypodium distachyon TaxID=15368 RepID=A0A0Q3HWU3_BRADI|nr:zinc finger CCCH domain-containing protein 1-like [Brachypodium distachyon]KQJ97922.1 hypothetical protein BRADI_3g34134v3 [Brachypodium distachyon]|eukprot:XP_024317904.1 zinc finger CCCH domain-containing protein 1-like [Brachypodium distachyon]
MERENNALDLTPKHVLEQSGGRPLRCLPQPPPQPSEAITLVGSPERLGQPPTKIYYKTKLCVKFEINGHCMYGDRCTFAHGSTELRRPSLATHGFAEGLAIRNPWEMRSEIPLARAAPGRAFPPVPAPRMRDIPRQMPREEEGGAKVSNLERLSWKKTSGIYGDWPEES